MFGEDALTDDELYTLGCFRAWTKVVARHLAGRAEQERADRQIGWEIFEGMSPEDQERFAE
jgi:hypothetical protein